VETADHRCDDRRGLLRELRGAEVRAIRDGADLREIGEAGGGRGQEVTDAKPAQHSVALGSPGAWVWAVHGGPVLALEGTTILIEIVANAAHCDVSAVVVDGRWIACDFIASCRAKLIGAVLGLDEFIEAGVTKTGLIGVALLDSDSPNRSITGMIPNVFKKLFVGPEFNEKLFVLGNENVPTGRIVLEGKSADKELQLHHLQEKCMLTRFLLSSLFIVSVPRELRRIQSHKARGYRCCCCSSRFDEDE
jgi:hypothetical protein